MCLSVPVPEMEVLVIGNVVMVLVVVDKVDKDDITVVIVTHSVSCVAVPFLRINNPN